MKGLMPTLLCSKSNDFNHLLAPQPPGLRSPMKAFESDWNMFTLKNTSLPVARCAGVCHK